MNQHNAPFLEAADRIGRKLCRDALWDRNRCTWLGWSMELINHAWVPAYRAFGSELYSGTGGIALFLAELIRYTGDREQRRILDGAVNHVLSQIDGLQGASRIGFYSGVSGIAWALERIGSLLGHDKLVSRSLAEMDTLTRIAPDNQFIDVIGGSAGAIPALLALGQRHGRSAYIDTAVAHGEHLIKLAARSERGWSWDTMHIPGQANLTGHSHGVAGVVTALLELHAATGEKRFIDAATQGLRYERSLYSAAHKNWPDLRIMNPGAAAPEPVYNMAWCHGAPGIGLSRLRNHALLPDDAEVKQEMEAAIQTTTAALSMPWTPGMGNYSLCHGACGNADTLLMAAQQLGRPELMQTAQKVGWEGIQHYAQADMPWPCGVAGAGEAPNLMLGVAGIGHYYLRLHDCAAVPSVLIVLPEHSVRADAKANGGKQRTRKEGKRVAARN